MKRLFPASLVVLFLAVTIFFTPSSSSAEARKPVPIEEGSPLPLRVLTRPQAKLYKDASEANQLEGQLPIFKPYFVYTRPGGEARETGTGWYEVGIGEDGKIAGWIKASDVFEWKQTMCLAFSHPQGRKPVLMFEEEEPLTVLLKETAEKRTEDVNKLYTAIDAAATTPLATDFPIISVEPKLAVDITKQFYLLPILEHKAITMESYEGRLLRLAAVSGKEDAKRDAPDDIRKNKEAVTAATQTEADSAKALKDIQYDIVWVMDTTRSMQPYIEEVRNTIEAMSKKLAANPELGQRIKFGLWAYRDSEEIKDIGYLTKNFTPALQPVDSFFETLKTVKETTIDSVDVNEDLFAGVHDAITKTPWSENAIRIIIVVGDAPSHEMGHKWNSTKQDGSTMRTIATREKVAIFGIHVKPKIRKKYNSLAQKQFKDLTTNVGYDKPMLLEVASGDRINFVKNSQEYAVEIENVLKATLQASKVQGEDPTQTAETTPEAPKAPPAAPQEKAEVPAKPNEVKTVDGGSAKEGIHQILQAATVTWLGRATETKAPNDIEAWVTDKDLTDPSIQSLEVRLLVSKRQLDSLAVVLNGVIEAGAEAQMGSGDFFTTLQSTAAITARNADQLAKATTLQDAGLVPAFLQGLPYESQIMTMSPELWESLGPDEQDQFIESLRGKIAAYQSINSTPDQWVALNQGDSADDYVTPIPLELLP